MFCIICKNKLEEDANWRGDIVFNCPVCSIKRSSNTTAPREESIFKGRGEGWQIRKGLSEMDWNKLGENA